MNLDRIKEREIPVVIIVETKRFPKIRGDNFSKKRLRNNHSHIVLARVKTGRNQGQPTVPTRIIKQECYTQDHSLQ